MQVRLSVTAIIYMQCIYLEIPYSAAMLAQAPRTNTNNKLFLIKKNDCSLLPESGRSSKVYVVFK